MARYHLPCRLTCPPALEYHCLYLVVHVWFFSPRRSSPL